MDLKKARKEARLSQRELAKIAGVSLPTVNHVESGKVTNAHAKTKRKLEKGLGIFMPKELTNNQIIEMGSLVIDALDKLERAEDIMMGGVRLQSSEYRKTDQSVRKTRELLTRIQSLGIDRSISVPVRK